jgi:CubicO group peptidase (beta-lactamase class C family)
MHDVMARHVERGEVPGVVTAVSRGGEVHVDAIGTRTADRTAPVQRDTIFRIASMTKPVTAVAAMILVEECRLHLDEPVDRFLPELADRRVLKRLDGPLDETVSAHRPITLRDLLTFRMGIGMLMARPDAYPILRAMADRDVAVGPLPSRLGPDAWMAALGALPLMDQPGARWLYHTGSDVLGVLIARAAGQPLGTFFRERIFDPLGMKDTGFSVPEAQLGRLATAYSTDPRTGAMVVFDDVADSRWSRPPSFPAGGGGLVSTVDDYLVFGRMLLDRGAHGTERILSRASVELMTTDQITAEQKAVSAFAPGFWDSRGWGFGVSVVTRRDDVSAVPGRFGWDGGYGTSWASDPAEDVVAILMTQRLWTSPSPPPVYLDFWTSVYQALD